MHIVISSCKPSRTAAGMMNIEVWMSTNSKANNEGSSIVCADLRYRKDMSLYSTPVLNQPAHDHFVLPSGASSGTSDPPPMHQTNSLLLPCASEASLPIPDPNDPPFLPDAHGCLFSSPHPTTSLPRIYLTPPLPSDSFIPPVLPPSPPCHAFLAVPPVSRFSRLDEDQELFYFPPVKVVAEPLSYVPTRTPGQDWLWKNF